MSDKQLYDPVRTERGKKLMRRARKTNAERDVIDRKHGGAAPADCPIDDWLRTTILAISVGLDQCDWTCVAEGLAMLQEAEVTVRSEERNGRASPPPGD